MNQHDLNLIRDSIRTIENWPEPGVSFRDVTTLLQNPPIFKKTIDIFIERYKNQKIDAVVGIDARGFIFGPVIAYLLGSPFIPIRKKGKLPFKTFRESYTLEYGDITSVEIHIDALKNDDHVIIVDDLIATGGTMIAACSLIKKLGAQVIECAVVNDLVYLKGSQRLKQLGFPVFSILEFN